MSRREQIRMTQKEIDSYLRSHCRITIISNSSNGYPHPMPMNYAITHDNYIEMTTYKKSQKVLNLERDKRATLLVETGDSYESLKSVLIQADSKVIDDWESTVKCMKACRSHANKVRGKNTTQEDDIAFDESSKRRSKKRLVLRFVPRHYISWDHSKLKGVY